MGKKSESKKDFDKAITNLNEKIIEYPNDPRFYSTLGLIYARLGKNKDAVEAGLEATRILPISKDAMFGPTFEKSLSSIYSIIGEKNIALEKIEFLSSIPSGFHYGELLRDPSFDSIRNEPRFQEVLKNLKPQS